MDSDLTGLWYHAFEEDEGDIMVFRPESHPLPPARGRRQLRFDPDGTIVFSAIGRGDAPEPLAGEWTRGGEQIALSFAGGTGPRRLLEIVEARPDMLRVRERTEPAQ